MSDYQEIKQLHHELKELADENRRLRLTDEEREVLGRVADDAGYRALEWTERVVRGMLERLG
jgi:regulator of replication initiation timing